MRAVSRRALFAERGSTDRVPGKQCRGRPRAGRLRRRLAGGRPPSRWAPLSVRRSADRLVGKPRRGRALAGWLRRRRAWPAPPAGL